MGRPPACCCQLGPMAIVCHSQGETAKGTGSVSRVRTNGELVWTTDLGELANGRQRQAKAVAIDSRGNSYVVWDDWFPRFPSNVVNTGLWPTSTAHGVAKLDSRGVVLWVAEFAAVLPSGDEQFSRISICATDDELIYCSSGARVDSLTRLHAVGVDGVLTPHAIGTALRDLALDAERSLWVNGIVAGAGSGSLQRLDADTLTLLADDSAFHPGGGSSSSAPLYRGLLTPDTAGDPIYVAQPYVRAHEFTGCPVTIHTVTEIQYPEFAYKLDRDEWPHAYSAFPGYDWKTGICDFAETWNAIPGAPTPEGYGLAFDAGRLVLHTRSAGLAVVGVEPDESEERRDLFCMDASAGTVNWNLNSGTTILDAVGLDGVLICGGHGSPTSPVNGNNLQFRSIASGTLIEAIDLGPAAYDGISASVLSIAARAL